MVWFAVGVVGRADSDSVGRVAAEVVAEAVEADAVDAALVMEAISEGELMLAVVVVVVAVVEVAVAIARVGVVVAAGFAKSPVREVGVDVVVAPGRQFVQEMGLG